MSSAALPDNQPTGENGLVRFFRESSPVSLVALAVLAIGLAAVAIPSFIYVAQESWNTEQGGHGPIVLVTGFWLLCRLWPEAMTRAKAPPLWRVILLFALLLPAYAFARVTQIVELDGYLMYCCILGALYSVIGGAAMRRLWFPLLYMVFMFPPPDTVVAWITLPMKTGISQVAIKLLQLFGYPIGGEGVFIYIGQYALLVAAACSGLNSIIALGAISLFYIYIRHEAEWHYALVLALFTVPVALLANFVRVICLILLTYYGGEATAQGFLHNFAGILMFGISVGTIFAFDTVLKRAWDRIVGNGAPVEQKQVAA